MCIDWITEWGENPCRKNTVSEKTLHGRHNEVYSSTLCKYLIFKQLGNIKFLKKTAFLRVGCYFFCTQKEKNQKKNIYFLFFISLMLYR